MAVKKGIKKQKPTAFGKRVKIELIRQEMTQTELASILGINKQYLYKIIYGIRPGVKYIDEIRRILKLEDVS
ncbi:transcriptional regulator [Enterocloster clostridioformis]|uniref:helix-turn-helix domain-containing protein n=1 Tax=Enterocloster clostridioformis TaxID=1531 RepID=UPI00080CBA03|nr:helix-turn-helix transcriptional regulator [Enterocloster clostridioformis]ANU47237.1 transcriptional regulator [Lachnoclostridium sp. YL32]WAK79668.1 transcriptional repressor [Clostridium phage Villandry]ANU47382.1 transcriptional regulator [Lachnoclostridium sp. YL32]NDO30994.1 helix-turn-helix transcriptional regulator [Enterocloster clostridioformis]OXE66429.1 transcriptional regulator [Enterocloster clostridioformis]